MSSVVDGRRAHAPPPMLFPPIKNGNVTTADRDTSQLFSTPLRSSAEGRNEVGAPQQRKRQLHRINSGSDSALNLVRRSRDFRTSRSHCDQYCISEDGLNTIGSKPKAVALPGLFLPPINGTNPSGSNWLTVEKSPRRLNDLSPSTTDRNVTNCRRPQRGQQPTSQDRAAGDRDDSGRGLLTKSDTNLYELASHLMTPTKKKQQPERFVKSCDNESESGFDDRMLRFSSVNLADDRTPNNSPTSSEQLEEKASMTLIGDRMDVTNRKEEEHQGVRLPRIFEPQVKRAHRNRRHSVKRSGGLAMADLSSTTYDKWS